MIESFTVVSWQWVQGCAGWCSGAAGLWASPIGAGVATWKWESWDTEHPPEMLAQAAQAGGGTRGYWCFLCVLVMGSIYIMDTNKNGLEVKVLPLSVGKRFLSISILSSWLEQRLLFRQLWEGDNAGLSPWRRGGDQDLGRERQDCIWGWDTTGLDWESSQKEQGYKRKRVAGHWFDSDTSVETTLAWLRQCHEDRLGGFRVGNQTFYCLRGAAAGACLAGWAMSVTMLGPRGSHGHACHSQEPRPLMEGGNGKAIGDSVIPSHLLGPAVWPHWYRMSGVWVLT